MRREGKESRVFFFFLVNERISPGAGRGVEVGIGFRVGLAVLRRESRRGRSSLFDQPLGDVRVSDLDLLVAGARVGELLAHVGVVQILPDGRHLFGNVEASVLLGHHLAE